MTRRILGYHLLAFLLLASLVSCQFEDDAISPDVYHNGQLGDYGFEDEDRIGEEEADLAEDQGDYIDNRIDAAPTYVTPVEKFIKTILAPFGWLGQGSSDSGKESSQNQGSSRGVVGTLITGITKPIKSIVRPAGRAVKGGFGQVLNLIGDRFKAIYPGTEWCGAGDSAKNSEELGLFQKTDSCCREHDRCNVNLEAGATDHGLRNNGIFTRSHCKCDSDFYHCLKQARSLVATNIGLTYFNILRPQCFKEEYPAHCVRYGRTRLRNNKCLDYDYDYSQNRTWQWFDSPDFL